MGNQTIGVLLCCGIELAPLAIGITIGMWLQRRVDRYGMPGALVPGFVRKILEDQKWQ